MHHPEENIGGQRALPESKTRQANEPEDETAQGRNPQPGSSSAGGQGEGSSARQQMKLLFHPRPFKRSQST